MLRDPRRCSAGWRWRPCCIAVNWGVYIYGVNTGQVVEAALGYFINPLVTVLLGVVVLRERLRRLQWVAVGVGRGRGRRADRRLRPPAVDRARRWPSRSRTYGLVKKQVGASVGAVASLTTETAVLVPLAAAAPGLARGQRARHVRRAAARARRCCWPRPASRPPCRCCSSPPARGGCRCRPWGCCSTSRRCCSCSCGVLVLGEHVPPSRWVGFALVWVALVVLTVDAVRQSRRAAARRASATPIMMRA